MASVCLQVAALLLFWSVDDVHLPWAAPLLFLSPGLGGRHQPSEGGGISLLSHTFSHLQKVRGQRQLPDFSFFSCCGSPGQDGCNHWHWHKGTSKPQLLNYPDISPCTFRYLHDLPGYPACSRYSLKLLQMKAEVRMVISVPCPLQVGHKNRITSTWEFTFSSLGCCLIALNILCVQILCLWMTWSKWCKRLFKSSMNCCVNFNEHEFRSEFQKISTLMTHTKFSFSCGVFYFFIIIISVLIEKQKLYFGDLM